jgi:ribonuclease T1
MKNVKLLIAAATLFFGAASVYADSTPVLNSLNSLSSSQVTLDIPAPSMRLLAQMPVNSDADNNSLGGGNANCTPNPAITPGTDFSPHISDTVRTQAIISLLQKIAACQPLPYAHDGIINTNSEGHMPKEPANYYKEYTLIVPGRNTGDGAVPVVIGGQTYMTGTVESARGPERIIIGQGNEIYYTMDHYGTFVRLTIVK